MIISFGDKETKKIFDLEFSKRIPRDIAVRALAKLIVMQGAQRVFDLSAPPSNHLEKLMGDLSGKWSIRINDQWRIIFAFDELEGGFKEVSLVDYH